MKVEYANCPRCEQSTPLAKPNCSRCGLWMPWGDKAVAEARHKRRRDFEAREAQEELDWIAVRSDHQAQAPREKVAWRLRRTAYLTTLSPARLAALSIGTAGLLVATTWGALSMLPRHTPRPETRATGRCGDGTWTYALNRSGACAGHGGVKVFYR